MNDSLSACRSSEMPAEAPFCEDFRTRSSAITKVALTCGNSEKNDGIIDEMCKTTPFLYVCVRAFDVKNLMRLTIPIQMVHVVCV